MYVAVVSLILGQGLFFESVRVLEYGIAVRVGFHLSVLLYEEPILRKSYGFEYEDFCTNVPRWIPHLRPRRRNQERSRLAQVRHDTVERPANSFRISLSDGKVCTTFGIGFQPFWNV